MGDTSKKPADDTSKQTSAWLADFVDRVKSDQNLRYGILGGALALVLLVIILVCVSCSKDENEKAKDGVSVNEVQPKEETAGGAETAGSFVPTTDAAVLSLVNTYYTALQNGDSATVASLKPGVSEEEKIRLEKKAEYIESVDNIQVYTRPGMEAGTYIAFIYTESKFANIETKAPGIKTDLIRTADDGSLCFASDVDDATMDYIKEVAKEPEIVDYFNKVTAEYSDALTSDTTLAQFMDSLPGELDAAVEAKQEVAADSQEAPEAAQVMAVNEIVKATDTVNVRASDSENAEKLGKVEAGTKLTRYETRNNGWSKVEYEGREAFIKSEYLQAEESAQAEEPEQEQPETEEDVQQDEGESQSQSAGTGTGSKVTVKEAVRVRASASTSGDVLGSVYQGETFELIMEQADGWCKISYKGKTAYIKTEFVEIN